MRFEVAGLGNALVDALVRIPNDAVLEELSLTRGLMHPVDDARWQLAKATVEDLGVELHTGGSCANTIATLGLMGLPRYPLISDSRRQAAQPERLVDDTQGGEASPARAHRTLLPAAGAGDLPRLASCSVTTV